MSFFVKRVGIFVNKLVSTRDQKYSKKFCRQKINFSIKNSHKILIKILSWLTSLKRMLSIWWDVKGAIYLLPGKTTVNVYRYRAQLNKLDAELTNNGLFSGKIQFQHENSKPQKIAKFS